MSVVNENSLRAAEQRRFEGFEAEKSRSRENHEREMENLKSSATTEAENANDEYNQRLADQRKAAQDEIRKLKEDLYDQKGKKFVRDSRDIADEKANYEAYRADLEKEYQLRKERVEQSANSRIRAAHTGQHDEIENVITDQKKSHQQEMEALREKLKILESDPRDVEHDRAVAKEKAIKEVVGPAQLEKEQIVQAYERNIRRMKDLQDQERQQHLAKLKDVNLNAQGKTAQVVRQQKKDFARHAHEKDLKVNQIESYYKDALKNEQKRSETGFEKIAANQTHLTEKALKTQEDVFRKDFQEQSARLNSDLGRQRNEIQKLKTTDDEMSVSPYLVEKIKNKSERHYYEQLQAERGRNLRQEDGLRARDAMERHKLRDQAEMNLMQTRKELTKSLDVEKRNLSDGYEDLKASKDNTTQFLREQHSDFVQRSSLKHAHDLELQQKRKLEELEGQRESLLDESNRKLDTTQLQGQIQKRELEGKFSQSRREYERKLTDQHEAHEMQLKELRLDYDAKLRNQERTLQRLSNDRASELEHQLKQQELSFKDRERILTEHYESELDSMKRTNALLTKKKS